jgi:hypothetical protein
MAARYPRGTPWLFLHDFTSASPVPRGRQGFDGLKGVRQIQDDVVGLQGGAEVIIGQVLISVY